MKNIEIKLIQDDTKSLGKMTTKTVLKKLQSILDGPYQYRTVYFPSTLNLKNIERAIKRNYNGQIEIRPGVSGGCFGARDGKEYSGLTLFCSPDLLPTSCIESASDLTDGKKVEFFNLYKLVNESGTLVEGLDGGAFEESCEDLGLKVKRDNTYNYELEGGACFMFDADYSVIESDKAFFLVIKWHCGGDVRGNYTDKEVYKFTRGDDLYCAMMPSSTVNEEEV
jgi:hypothetical protein